MNWVGRENLVKAWIRKDPIMQIGALDLIEIQMNSPYRQHLCMTKFETTNH
jgi:hypothetical protein